jgi:hypothetical protein
MPKTQPIEIIYSESMLSKLRYEKFHAAVKYMLANTKEQEKLINQVASRLDP